jgi:enoyl-CoA hydratase/carnithine racemase
MPVSYDQQDHIGIITISRPEARNAWGDDFNEGIAHYFAAMEDDDDIRCAVLTGDDQGGAFSAGANLTIVWQKFIGLSQRCPWASPVHISMWSKGS